MKRKDMSDRKFLDACKRNGIDFDMSNPMFAMLGYVGILHNPDDPDGRATNVSVLNAGTTNKRRLLAWLIGEAKRIRSKPENQ